MAKQFAWSFSKLKNYETCPNRYHKIDVLKQFKDEGDALIWGNQVHGALADAVGKAAELPENMTPYKEWVDHARPDENDAVFVEQKYAITKDFRKTSWFAPDVWYRGIADVVKIRGNVALVIDWKTGKFKPDEYRPQLMLVAQCVFSHFTDVQRIACQLVWLQDDTSTIAVFDRETIAEEWPEMLERVNALAEAHRLDRWPEKPSGLCKRYCPVTSCPFHGKGR